MAKSPLATSKKQRINSSVEIPDMDERHSLCQIGRQGQPLSPAARSRDLGASPEAFGQDT